jgi:3-dehydroquinate dehydratase / shikimate dehydrogenase
MEAGPLYTFDTAWYYPCFSSMTLGLTGGFVFREGRICGVVAATTAREMECALRQALRRTRTVELRLDYLRSAREREAFLSRLERLHPRATMIATCRSRRGGGPFSGSPAAQRDVLIAAVRAGCKWCDIEIEALAHWPQRQLKSDLRPARILLSYHDFRRTPRKLVSVVRRLDRAPHDAIKIATECGEIRDATRILELTRGRRDRVVVPMGELGVAARILALRAGSALAYAPVSLATAPGQTSLDELAQLYRADKLTRRTRVYGVIGDPIAHSLSPLMQNTAFRARRIDAVYVPFRVLDLRDFAAAIAPLGVSGFSITLPHKEEILRYLDDCDPLAREIGAVNTVVVRSGGSLYGYNTDYVAVLRAVERRVRLAGSRVLLLGAGGAARAAAFALSRAGAIVSICARRPQRAVLLARAVGGEAIPRRGVRGEFFDAIVNCTPLGLRPGDASPLSAAEMNCRIVMDMIYRPRVTKFLRLAKQKGIETITGVDMFVAQGAAQWEIWTGMRAPEAAMRTVVERALAREERTRI